MRKLFASSLILPDTVLSEEAIKSSDSERVNLYLEFSSGRFILVAGL